LTSRERDVLDLLMLGLMNKQIAAELNLSEVMVKVRRGHIMHKMQAKTLVDLVRMSDAIQIAGLAPATMDSGL
jgi:FixJ family two-component response regulator